MENLNVLDKFPKYNRGEGKSLFAHFFNSIFSSYATEVNIVAQTL